MCSTPVGIKDRFTGMNRPVISCRRCAQRLSASKIGSHPEAKDVKQWFGCSTPVGIKDRFTVDRLRHCQTHFVLNACRHQRSVHLFSALAAGCSRKCSTPVGIKDRFTRSRVTKRRTRCVLNACRHQRSVH